MDVRILIVDDHPTVRESLRFVFAAAGMQQTVGAATWQEAVDALRGQRFDLVLLDITLGDDNGLDALQDIKTIDASIPVLIHSWHDSAGLLSCSFHLGAAGYVIKGNDKNDLIHAAQQAAAGADLWTAGQMARIHDADAKFESSRSRQRFVKA